MKKITQQSLKCLFIILAYCFQLASLSAQTAKDTVIFKTGYITVNGVKLFYREAGEGKPMLFLHGTLATDERHFSKQLEEFDKKNRVIALHLRAHGKSSFPDGDFKLDYFTDDVYKFLESLKLDSVIVVGFSFGGVIGLDLASKHPQKVKKLVTIGAFSNNDALKESALKDIAGWGDETIKFITSNFKDYPEPDKIPLYLQKLKAAFIELKEPQIKEEALKKIACPTLLVFGDLDFFSKIEHQVYLHKTIPKSNLCIMPKTPHMVQAFRLEIFNKLLWEFIEK
jgi:pimeloyl-ACP methyl ester carboxylesterase